MASHTLDHDGNATDIHATYAISLWRNDGKVARIARVQVAAPQKHYISASNEVISSHWLISSEGLAPIHVTIHPPCTKSIVMALHQNA